MAHPDELILSDVYLSNHYQMSTLDHHLHSTTIGQYGLYDEKVTRFAYRNKTDDCTQEEEDGNPYTIIGQLNDNVDSDGDIQYQHRKQYDRRSIQEEEHRVDYINSNANVDGQGNDDSNILSKRTIIGQLNNDVDSNGDIQNQHRKQYVERSIHEEEHHIDHINTNANANGLGNDDTNVQSKRRKMYDNHNGDEKDDCISITSSKFKLGSDSETDVDSWKGSERSDCYPDMHQTTSCSTLNVSLDSDGDIQLKRKKRKHHHFGRSILIRHCMATRLQHVGLQVWRGALLMCDFIIHNPQLFQDCCCLELGAGVGLTSILIASYAKRIYATDFGHHILHTCYQNIQLNDHLYTNRQIHDIARVRQLNWLHGIPKCNANKTELQSLFCWQDQDIVELYDHVDTIVACDVIYDDQQTDALMMLIKDILALNCHNKINKKVYITMEKRINFTLHDLEETAPAYNHFLITLNTLIQNGHLSAQPIAINFPQYFQYERVQQLEMWELTLHHQS